MADAITIGEADRRTGSLPRACFRSSSRKTLVAPSRSEAGYRHYGVLELNQAAKHRRISDKGSTSSWADYAFVVRLGREQEDCEPPSRPGSQEATATEGREPAWVEWERRKHERLLAALEAA